MFVVNSQIFCVQSSICAAKGNKPLLLIGLLNKCQECTVQYEYVKILLLFIVVD